MIAAGPWGEMAAAGQRARDRTETPSPAALGAARVDGLAGFRESAFCSSPPLWCRDLQVSCALCLDPLTLAFCLATTSLLGQRAGYPSTMGV